MNFPARSGSRYALADLGAAQTAEIFLCLIGACAVEAVSLRIEGPMSFKSEEEWAERAAAFLKHKLR
jgi:hypothetical protein